MKIYGITGLMGSGKSTAATYLKGGGFPVLDADDASRIVLDKNTEDGREGFAQVYKMFGSTVLNSLGQLDRRALAKRIMTSEQDRERLEDILHPRLHEYIRKKMTGWKTEGIDFGFIEGSRLIESKIHDVVAGVIKVTASESNRAKRLMKRDSIGKEEAQALVQMQDGSLVDRFAKFEWKNDKKISDLEQAIEDFIIKKRKEP